MNTFKVGDWVQETNTEHKTISKITNILSETNLIEVNNIHYYNTKKDELKLWQPKEGEWCWFYEDGVFATIGQYGGDNGDSKHWMRSHTLDLWDSVEPFIGTLPSFIKDIR